MNNTGKAGFNVNNGATFIINAEGLEFTRTWG